MKRWIRMPRLLFAALALVAAALAAGCARSPEGRAQMAVDFAADYLELEKEQEAPLVVSRASKSRASAAPAPTSASISASTSA